MYGDLLWALDFKNGSWDGEGRDRKALRMRNGCLGRRLQKDEASEDDGGANWRESESQRSGDHL